ncbi:MAG: hypothetical protein AAFQ94_31570 [Bacteroidota bacterium]
MRVPEEQFELIVKYVDADLQESEKESFNELVISSEPFRKELLEVEMIVASIKAIGRQQNVKRVQNIIQKVDSKKETKRRRNRRLTVRLGIAASITLLTIFSFFSINRSNLTGVKSIYESYYEPYPSARLFRNEAETSKGMQLYGSQQYEQAIPYLEAERKQQEGNQLLELYIANSYMMSGRFAESEKILNNTKATAAETLIDQYIYWYLGLTLLQMDKESEAMIQFRELAKEGGIYEKEATAILKALK